MKISVITPTLFRTSLKYCVSEVARLLRDGDEHIVVRDSSRPPANQKLYETVMNEPGFYEMKVKGSAFGNGQRDFGIRLAKGEALVFLDDDDLPFEDGYKVLHDLEYDKDTMHIFRMLRLPDKQMFYAEAQTYGGIGCPMVVVPNRPDLPSWAEDNTYASDFIWFTKVAALPGMKIVCHDELIAIIPVSSLGQ